MVDIKTLLKEARDAIKGKNFQLALRISKTILKEDKTNYMALVFLGLSLQEVGPLDHTPKAFRKAIDIDPSNPLAWQGLISYYEKVEATEGNPELVELYISYLNVESNERKILEYSKKLTKIAKYGDIVEIFSALYKLSKKCPRDYKIEISKVLSQLLEAQDNVSVELIEVYENVLNELVSTSSVTESVYSAYIVSLNKISQHLKILEHSIKMHKIFPTSVFALSWICRIFNRLYIEEDPGVMKYVESIKEYVDNLLYLDPKNAMGLFTKAVLLVKTNQLAEASKILTEVTSQRPCLVYAWTLLTDVLIKLQLFDQAWKSWNKTKELLETVNNESISKKVGYQEVELLSMSSNENDWGKAVKIYSEENFDYFKCLPSIITININLEHYGVAERYISEFKCIEKEKAELFHVILLKKQKKYSEALEFFEKSCHNFAEWWIEMGLLFWNMEQYKHSLEPFLKAAKCDPNNYLCFIYLGHYYGKFNQLDKARRCYEKAFKLNSKCSVAGSELSKIYRKQKNWDANLNLLTSLTQDSINDNNLWAWMQLGLTYLEQGDALSSIECLRMVLRIDFKNVHCWESLADAYFARGSFTSALKCYQKASDLSHCSLYPTLQVAYIKKILGEYSEAKKDFEIILLDNKYYVPALKGLAETCFCQARECYKEQRLGTSRDYAQIAANKITLAILQRSELSCLWKQLADYSLFVAKLPEKYSCLSISKSLLESKISENDVLLEEEELFDFATKCYCKAVSLAKDNAFLWHDLGTCYLTHAYHLDDPIRKTEIINYALAASQQCITLNSGNWQHWNLLGNVAMLTDPPNYALAQHCFIKAVIADHNSSVAWSNLGILYLLLGDIKLANKAFGQGQRADPNYVNSWIGQAIIAESMGHADAMDLFRHSTQLGQHQQGSLGYGHWVCKLLLSSLSNDKTVQYSIHNMHAIPVACDVVNWYTEKNPDNACAWNMLGILYERMGLKSSAKAAFRNAYMLADKKYSDKAKINYGRLLYQAGNYEKAIEIFTDVEEATFSSGTGLALALFRDGRYEESYAAYEQALHWLTEEQTCQSELLVALASMAYKFQGPDAAKTLLFQSIELKPPSPWSLYSTFSLALLHLDLKLAKLVLNELRTLEKQIKASQKAQSEFIYHYCIMLSYLYMMKDELKEAKIELSKLTHKYPSEGSTWLTLSQILYKTKRDSKHLEATAKFAQAAMKIGQVNMDVSKVLYLSALSFYMAGDSRRALISAQKAIHYYPNLPEGLALIAFILITGTSDKILSNNYFKNLHNCFNELKCNDNILSWSKKYIFNL